jgi:hypothetical protein
MTVIAIHQAQEHKHKNSARLITGNWKAGKHGNLQNFFQT